MTGATRAALSNTEHRRDSSQTPLSLYGTSALGAPCNPLLLPSVPRFSVSQPPCCAPSSALMMTRGYAATSSHWRSLSWQRASFSPAYLAISGPGEASRVTCDLLNGLWAFPYKESSMWDGRMAWGVGGLGYIGMWCVMVGSPCRDQRQFWGNTCVTEEGIPLVTAVCLPFWGWEMAGRVTGTPVHCGSVLPTGYNYARCAIWVPNN